MTDELFDVTGKCVALTGGAGVLCSEMARALAARGAKVAVLDIMDEAAAALCDQIASAGGQALATHCNVLEKIRLEEKGFQLESEMILRAAEMGEKIAFVNIPTIYAGEGSNIANINDTLRFIRLILREIRYRITCLLREKTRKWLPLSRRKEYPM